MCTQKIAEINLEMNGRRNELFIIQQHLNHFTLDHEFVILTFFNSKKIFIKKNSLHSRDLAEEAIPQQKADRFM